MAISEKIGFIGLGKLGLPCAAAMSVKTGQSVIGFDLNPSIKTYILDNHVPYLEAECDEYLAEADIHFAESIEEVVRDAERIFIAVQTPHEEKFEGITPVSDDLKDFDYTILETAINQIARALESNQTKKIQIVVISTVLPGTMRKIVLPPLAKFKNRVKFCYNPFFIAMGQTIHDFLHPEFVLIGCDDLEAGQDLANFYKKIHSVQSEIMKIESAELTKVAYNTFIGFKIVFANTLREIVCARGGNVDEVTSALTKANSRLMSGKYMTAGMGDGGGCHPRDQIAMSWLAKNANLSSDIFGFLAKARDSQSLNQAKMIARYHHELNLPVTLLGAAYKPDINLTVGSPALLLSNQLTQMGIVHDIFDPLVFPDKQISDKPGIFFVSTNHSCFRKLSLPEGSTVIDPWFNSIEVSQASTLIRPGRD